MLSLLFRRDSYRASRQRGGDVAVRRGAAQPHLGPFLCARDSCGRRVSAMKFLKVRLIGLRRAPPPRRNGPRSPSAALLSRRARCGAAPQCALAASARAPDRCGERSLGFMRPSPDLLCSARFADQQGGRLAARPLRRQEGCDCEELRRGHQQPAIRARACVRHRKLPAQGTRPAV